MSKSSNRRKVKQLQVWITQELRFGKGKWNKVKWNKKVKTMAVYKVRTSGKHTLMEEIKETGKLSKKAKSVSLDYSREEIKSS